VYRSSDAKTGQYALELKTYLGEQNNLPRAQPSCLTSGYWDDNCGCIRGGLPYTFTKDTLAFWYKYTPQSNDQAQVYLDFQKNNTSIGSFFSNLNVLHPTRVIDVSLLTKGIYFIKIDNAKLLNLYPDLII